MSTRYLFLGPSLPADQALALVPGVHLLPPVAMGDLLRLPVVPGDVVGVVDGYFRQTGAVRHKEILHLLDEGVHVLGASSMGALRAAELSRYGMVGVGEVFRLFASGELDGDDEVALQHLPAEEGYRPTSEALVNVRHNLRLAQEAGLVSESTRHAFLELAKALPFTSRVLGHLFARAREAGLPPDELTALQDFFKHRRVDLKREDALELLRRMARGEETATPPPPRMHHTTHFHRMQHTRTGRQADAELFISDKGVLSLFQVCAPAYPAFQAALAPRTLVALHAEARGLEVPSAEALVADFRARQALAAPEEFSRWLEGHHLTLRDLTLGLRHEALVQRAVEQHTGAPSPTAPTPELLEPLVVEALVERGVLESGEALPEGLWHWTSPEERASLPPSRLLSRFAVRSFCIVPNLRWAAPALIELKRRGAFGEGLALLRRVLHFNRLFRERYPHIVLERLAPQAMMEWLGRHWGVAGDVELAALDRGLAHRGDCVQSARVAYLFDKQHPGELRLSIPGLG